MQKRLLFLAMMFKNVPLVNRIFLVQWVQINPNHYMSCLYYTVLFAHLLRKVAIFFKLRVYNNISIQSIKSYLQHQSLPLWIWMDCSLSQVSLMSRLACSVATSQMITVPSTLHEYASNWLQHRHGTCEIKYTELHHNPIRDIYLCLMLKINGSKSIIWARDNVLH